MSTTVTDPNARTSFFDDDDLSIKFEFVKPEKANFHMVASKYPSKISDTLHKRINQTNTFQQGYYSLVERFLVYYKAQGSKVIESVIELSNARLIKIQTTVNNYQWGFSLTKNGNTYEFFANDETLINNWFAALRQFCLLTNFHDEYKALKMIGKGSFAKVYLVESKQNQKQYAVKAFTKESVIISNKANAKPSMINEIDIMRSVSHENVIQLYDVYETEKSIYLVLELIQGKSLQDILKKSNFREEFSELKCINMIRMILDALAYLSTKSIMHRDLKPDNILLDKGEKIKIVDFGLATFINVPEYIFKKCGTPGYIAPEVFKYDAKNPTTFYDDKCDVFSAGCILYYMLFGRPFFDGSNASEILRFNRKFTVDYESVNNLKDEIKNPHSKINKEGLNLLANILEFDHKKRISAAQSLGHGFFLNLPLDTHVKADSSSFEQGLKSKESLLFKEKDSIYKVSENSPRNIGWKVPAPNDFSNPGSMTAKDHYVDKGSFYLDVGKPDITGKVDTLTSGSTNFGSIHIASSGPGSNAAIGGSGSNFGPKTTDKKLVGGKQAGGNKNDAFRKLILLKNQHLQMEGGFGEGKEESKENVSYSAGDGKGMRGPDSDEFDDDDANEHPQVASNVEKINIGSPATHPSKMLQKRL
jgi:serine/threonine protein kinase